MNAAELHTYIAALTSSLTINVIIPLVMFAVMMAGLAWVLILAQRGDHFDASEFLRDETGKLSYLRLCGIAALASSTWIMAVETFNARMTPLMLFVFLGAWSGALVFVKLAERWNGQLPWAK
jgi:hypothetical protein